MAKLGEICLINPKSCTLRDDTEVSFIPMTKVGEHGEFDASEIKNYSEVKKGFTNFQNGDILFAKITPCMENGKGAIAHNMKNGIGFGSTEFHVLRPDTDKITSEWLYYLTTWKAFRKEAERNMTGSAGQKRVPKTFLENYVVNLPDIDTQKSENKILRKVDDFIFLRKQQLAKLDELIKARFVEMFGDPVNNPMNYPKSQLGKVCDVRDGTHDSPEYYDVGYPLVTSKNVTGGKIDLSECNLISEDDYKKICERSKVDRGDIIMPMIGTVGKPVIVNTEPMFAIKNVALIKFTPDSLVTNIYIKTLLESDYFDRAVLDKIRGGTQKFIALGDIRKLEIILPDLKHQQCFSTFVERVNQQKQTVQQSLEKLELMKKALMQEYFG